MGEAFMPQDARTAFSRATELHRQGRYDEAIEIYRHLLKAQPTALDTQRLLTFALLQAGHPDEAMASARQACALHPTRAEAQMLMGAVFQVSRQWEKALVAFDAACALQPSAAEAHYLAGNTLSALGRHSDAVARYDRAVALDPKATEALANRARAYARLNRQNEALADCERLVGRQPNEAAPLVLKAGILLDFGHFAEAVIAAKSALELEPRQYEAHLLHGQGLEGQGRFEEARLAFNTALSCAPRHTDILARLAGLERRKNQPDRAAAICDTALALDPACTAILYERGEARRELGDVQGALADVNAALERWPDDAPALTLKARLMADLGDIERARSCIDAACRTDSHYPPAIYLRATDQLARGQWSEGWAGYESRSWFLPAPYETPSFRRWDGVEMPEELIVVGETHLPDLLLFARHLRSLADRGIATRLLTSARNVPLLSRVDARVLVQSDLTSVDISRPGLRWAPLGSLPGLMNPDPAKWPRPPYLTADPERVLRWRHLAEGEGANLHIGICWQEDPARTVDGGRSIPLEAFAPLAAIEGVSLISLQQGGAADQLERVSFADRIMKLDQPCDEDGVFLDSSGILQQLDVVVTCDSALCHLAGARGRPVFTALRAVPDWYWGLTEERSPLYPTMRLFRQKQAGEWGGVFASIATAVQDLVKERRAAAAARAAAQKAVQEAAAGVNEDEPLTQV
ncbi:tetratricopeptide repeat protein [Xanthobacter sp. TB0139]|uniref:tetratricopeptide repeat protein n=1 Tax=Xanthobacter sp. TB0139 TaxID=3459178 RepID=UPI00403A25BD